MSAARASPKTGLDMPAAAWRKAFARAYKAMDKDLRSHPALDSFCSGSTAVTVLKLVRGTAAGHSHTMIHLSRVPSEQKCQITCFSSDPLFVRARLLTGGLCTQGTDLYMANIGDSRAVLGSRDAAAGGMAAVQLTVDLKPDVPSTPLHTINSAILVLGLSVLTPAVCDVRRGGADQEVQGQGVRAAGRAGGAEGVASVRRRAGPGHGAGVRGLLPQGLRRHLGAGLLPLASHGQGPVRHPRIRRGNYTHLSLLSPISLSYNTWLLVIPMCPRNV
ncbi:unnamed protein product [Triticum turgidum subsp. durum]|uniref:protein-serine/threonine phosphatase n=1 Tax=Triticum turgidum subsp. durum TaxID=4567 RepID=A0A9R1R5B2_TRITD|nr:unnamed protein product [Triticum turgidum subsp. durum]